ncbi:MAG TPA: UDP-N-acetylmuramoyl-L-alanine--D-glutamate ligase [Ktedonobacteraceae bacterium]|nr:UDP-N-acetylmuramoyl-L-alanine--D-glutamate ligase [Ktedonobacteraceae bacterium]
MNLRGKRVLIMGLGLHGSGIASARYASQHGAVVRVTDLRSAEILSPSLESLSGLPIEYVLGEHRTEDFLWAEIVIHVPGIRRDSPYLQVARENGACIEQEIALFFEACPGKIIGVTGTRGKTTTTTLIYQTLRANGMKTVIGGNVSGVETLSLLPTISRETFVVLELSSWQLEGLAPHKISPCVSVMTNIYPDHLDTYQGMEEYADAKANIFRYQHETDVAIFNYDNLWTRRLGEEAKSETWYTSLESWGSFVRHSTQVFPFLFSETPLRGKHNLENILLATTTARLLGVPDEVIGSTVRNFRGVAQRLEEIAIVKGVHYINDTTSTTPVAGRVALNAFDTSIVLVAGGNTKFLPLDDWPETIVKKCRDVVLLEGTGTHKLLPAIEEAAQKLGIANPVRGVFDDFTAAMDTAVSLTHAGDVLLFSPGFTSFGMFLNEFDRGDNFVAYVRRLEESA